MIFARKVSVLFKSGVREDYTHVTRFEVRKDKILDEYMLHVSGETDDVAGMRCNTNDKLPIAQIHMTVVDWYIPPE